VLSAKKIRFYVDKKIFLFRKTVKLSVEISYLFIVKRKMISC